MFLKKRLYLLFFLLPLLALNACLFGNDSEEIDLNLYTDAEVISFRLSHDSIPDLKDVVFSIDQRKNIIYNYDSMAYGTLIEDKVVVTYTSGSRMDNLIYLSTEEDSLWLSSGDSLDILSTSPAKLRAYALDGKTTKLYSFYLNIHQTDPDSMQYKRIASGLNFATTDKQKSIQFKSVFYTYLVNNGTVSAYTSANAENWDSADLFGLPANIDTKSIVHNGTQIYACTDDGDLYSSYNALNWTKLETDYPVTTILGCLKESNIQKAGLCAIVSKDGASTFAFLSDWSEWKYGIGIPETFPSNGGFSTVNQEIVSTQRLTIFGGETASNEIVNSIWSTLDGLYWSKITDDRISNFPHITDANTFIYNGLLTMINGRNEEGYNTEIYISSNNGYTWSIREEEKYKPEESYLPRSGASFILDQEGVYFYLIGGDRTEVWSEIWKGFQNKSVFDH